MQLAVQLYTLRHRLDSDVEGTLDALAEAGARHVELAGLYGRTPAQMRAALDAAGLTAPAAHVPLDRFEDLDPWRELGVETVVVPSVPEDVDLGRLTAAAQRAADAGLRFAYHNHDFEFRGDLWERIVALGLGHEPDVGWLYIAGRDPVAVLGELRGRAPLVHAKDVRAGTDVPVGDGELDWPAIAAAARDAGSEWLVVELDHPSADPVEDVRRSLATLAPLA